MQFREQAILVEEPLSSSHNFCPDRQRCSLLREALSRKERIEDENEELKRIFTLAREEFEKRNKRIEHK